MSLSLDSLDDDTATRRVLDLARRDRDLVYDGLEVEHPKVVSGLDISMMQGELDNNLFDRLLAVCARLVEPGLLRVSHIDLCSGTACEQRLYDLGMEKAVRENEKKFFEKKKFDSSKQKDFAASAAMRREGQEGIDRSKARLEAIAEELATLEIQRDQTPWHRLFTRIEAQERNQIRCLDLSDCCLHATGLTLLTQVLLDLEHRGDGVPVTRLVLDGNDLGDISSGAIASYLRLTSHLEALQLRNVGFTDQGVAQVVAGIASNKSLAMLDLRCNGLCTSAAKEVVNGLRRFNRSCEILLE